MGAKLLAGIGVPSSVMLPSEAVARTYLDSVGARLRSAGIQAESVLRTGPPAATIVQEALIHDVCLIVLGTNIRPTLSSAVLGSVADQVARAAPCPVLFVHPEGFDKVAARNHLQPKNLVSSSLALYFCRAHTLVCVFRRMP